MNSDFTSEFFFQLDEFYLDLCDDGNINPLQQSEIEQRPFPGLRPFKTSEFQLFQGRDGQAEELISRLQKNRFLSVIGSSGTGKSSLVRAGLIPQLLGGYLEDAGTNWDIAICRPGKNPLKNLGIALARIRSRSNAKEAIQKEFGEIAPLIDNSIYGILAVNELLNPPATAATDKSNLLIIVDQFEELFRFDRADLNKPEIETHFVNLLLKASARLDNSVYVIITMRSEFLGDAVKYRGLPEAINAGQYLVPQLGRERLKEVIEEPIKLSGKTIAPGLVELLINEIEQSKTKKDLDQLPIMQHALMRTYGEAQKGSHFTEINYGHYKECGGMEGALANHAEAKYKELGDTKGKISKKQQIAKIVFQALTDASTDAKGGRRPTELTLLYKIAQAHHATEKDVNEVIDHFRDTETSFIMPPLNTPLHDKLVIDISHESLMRQWERLRSWVAEEAASSQTLLRLAQSETFYSKKEKDLLTGKELALIADWQRSFNPQAAWANRYVPDFTKSLNYLEESKRSGSRKRWLVSTSATVLALALLVGFYFIILGQAKKEEQKSFYKKDFLAKKDVALKNKDTLAAALYLAEGMLYADGKDSLLYGSTQLLPAYFLENAFKSVSDVEEAAFSANSDSLFLWNKALVCYVWDASKAQLNQSPGKNAPPEAVAFNSDSVPPLGWTEAYQNDSTFGAYLNNKTTGKKTGAVMLHSKEIEVGILSEDLTRIAIWGGEYMDIEVRVFKKTDLVKRESDLDIPPELFRLQLNVMTGAELNRNENRIQCIPRETWSGLYKDWQEKARAHFEKCAYKRTNYWASRFKTATNGLSAL